MARMRFATEALREAVSAIDGEFGAGYAKNHPQILRTFMRQAEARRLEARRNWANGAAISKQDQIELVGCFLDSETELAPQMQIQARRLYDAFSAWCERNGERRISETAFAYALRDHGLRRLTGRLRFWLDIKLKNENTS